MYLLFLLNFKYCPGWLVSLCQFLWLAKNLSQKLRICFILSKLLSDVCCIYYLANAHCISAEFGNILLNHCFTVFFYFFPVWKMFLSKNICFPMVNILTWRMWTYIKLIRTISRINHGMCSVNDKEVIYITVR